MSRIPLVVGNWKMHKTVAESLAMVTELKNQLAMVRDVEFGVAPVFTSLHPVAKRIEGTQIRLCAQDCFWEDQGAFTGEVSVSLLKDVGCSHVIVGHSERRQLFGELDAAVGLKVRAVLRAGLVPIACVGETEKERDAGETFGRVAAQLEGALSDIPAADASPVVIAYEPVWAIGTGRTATPAQAEEVHRFIRERLRERWGGAAESTRIQYGGSVKPENAAELMAQANIDGALVGGASLKAESFTAIVKACRPKG
ncbi:MAG: triose-phosphate isomerase [Deltaproteobacteria bacterium]|nr:triose-phosphate isomerase [Deltaproteobacteria bacterium]